MKHSAYPYIITGLLCLCAILAVFFLLVLPGLTAVPEPRAGASGVTDISAGEAEDVRILTLALVDAEQDTGALHLYHGLRV